MSPISKRSYCFKDLIDLGSIKRWLLEIKETQKIVYVVTYVTIIRKYRKSKTFLLL